jgi:hypothetical protein
MGGKIGDHPSYNTKALATLLVLSTKSLAICLRREQTFQPTILFDR